MHTLHTTPSRSRSGNTLIEIMIALGLFAVVFLSSVALMESGQRFSKSTLEITTTEDLAQQMLFRIERLLLSASPGRPSLSTTLGPGGLPAGSNVVTLSDTDGFPPVGTLVVEPDVGRVERIRYEGLGVGNDRLAGLTRATQCTEDLNHLAGATAIWGGVAEPIAFQGPQDGLSLELGTQTPFRGDGSGFSFQVPVDPTGGGTFVIGDQVSWGADVRGIGQTLDGRSAIYFEPQTTFDEALENADVNGDGDRVDVFDMGQLRRVSWDTTAPNMEDDVGLGPSVVIQEQCNWGGDLDSDGFDDPLFLWTPDTNELHVRMFILGVTSSGLPVVRRVESLIFLRNEAES